MTGKKETESDLREKAERIARVWYHRVQSRVLPVVAFTRLVKEGTIKWVFGVKNQSHVMTYFQVKEALKSPARSVCTFINDREVEALGAIWNLGWDSTHPTGRKYPLVGAVVQPKLTPDPKVVGSDVK